MTGSTGSTGPAGPPGAAGISNTWNGVIYQQISASAGKITHFNITAPDNGFITVIAHFSAKVRNKYDVAPPPGTTVPDCDVYTELSTTPGSVSRSNGTSTLYVVGNLPTHVGGGTYQSFPQSVSRSFPVTAGATTTYYLNGAFGLQFGGCSDVVWDYINFTAFFSKQNATISPVIN
jgi:hypothetical protein